jgi:hypothetical protein
MIVLNLDYLTTLSSLINYAMPTQYISSMNELIRFNNKKKYI